MRVALAVVLSVGAATGAYAAQGRITGALTDQAGAILRKATIEIKNLESDFTESTITGSDGLYSFQSLPAGCYQVTAFSAGFEKSVQTDIRVTEGKEVVVDFVLHILGQETVVVVTAPAMSGPLVIETDPRAPRQPIPANDGADYLKAIPGFSIIRKGGTDGDPTLRGMAGSRLNILLDGQQILGGCGGRMDPPTAYVFPDVYQRITVLKGPQTVLYGPNASAGTVLFERERTHVEHASIPLAGSSTVGSFGRLDEMFDARAAIPNGYVEAITTRSQVLQLYRSCHGQLQLADSRNDVRRHESGS